MALKLEDRIAAFAEQARVTLQAQPEPVSEPLRALRRDGEAAFADAGLPGPKNESWKYSRIGPLLEDGLLDQAPSVAASAEVSALGDARTLSVTVLDGRPQPLADDLPAGLQLTRFSDADASQRQRMAELLGQLAPAEKRPYVALNGALVEDGLFIEVAPGARIELPLELIIAQSADARPHGAHPRVLVALGEGAELTLLERHLGSALALTNAVIEVELGPQACLQHMRLQLDAGQARSLTALAVRLRRDASYALHQVLRGSRFRRNEIHLAATEPGAEIEVGGATLCRDRNHLDTQMCVEHVAPHCSSNQVFRALGGERSRTVLNGRIHIHPHAQKTAAELNTRNLLLSADAEIDAKPELEIYADDVTCAHGATVGQLDAMALFYLRSRGLSETEARTQLSFAFLGAVVDRFPDEAVRAAVRPLLEAAFSAPAERSPS